MSLAASLCKVMEAWLTLKSKTRLDRLTTKNEVLMTCRFSGLRAVLSGPAGGVVGHARTSYDPEDPKPVIG